MQYLDIIQASLDWIEDNLKADITADELSAAAGFSLFHYYRLFQGAVGMPLMQYIARRRLLWAVYEMSLGKKQVDSALEFGFDTSAGFYKAFLREYGYSPSDYAKRFPSYKPYRINLIQEEKLMLTHKKIKLVFENWNIEDSTIKDVVNENTGSKNENAFYIGEGYILKVYTSLGRLNNNIAVASALHESGLGSAAPVKTKSGKSYVQDGEFYYILTERLIGEPLQIDELFREGASEKARYLGEILGQLHRVLKANDGIVSNDRNIYDEVISQAFPVAKKLKLLPEEFYSQYEAEFGTLYDKLPLQLIHRDATPGNIIMQDGKLTGFIDFDLCQRSIRLFAPCYAATAILSEVYTRNIDTSKWFDIYRSIIEGYDSVVCLTEDEKRALPYVVFSIQLICVAWFADKDKYKALAGTNTVMLDFMLKNRNLLEY